MENRRSHLDIQGANTSCCNRGLNVHPRVIGFLYVWMLARTDTYKGANSSEVLWFSASSSSNHLSKPPYPVHILTVTYIKQSIIRLKTSYRHLIEQENGRIPREYSNSNHLGRSSLDPRLLVPRFHLHVCRCPRVSHCRLECLCSSAVFLGIACLRLRTYLQVLVGIIHELRATYLRTSKRLFHPFQ